MSIGAGEHNYSANEYALHALRMFTAAGRWAPIDRLTRYGTRSNGLTAIWRLRKEGWRIERHMHFSEYRLIGMDKEEANG